jgi:hypothetical protein
LSERRIEGDEERERRTDVVSIAVEQVHANALVEQILEVLTEVRENEVTGVLELAIEYRD